MENKVSSIARRKIQIEGDSIISNKVVEQTFFGENGNATRHISRNEWNNDSTIIDNKDYLVRPTVSKVEQCDYRFSPALLKLVEITGVRCLPKELTNFLRVKMKQTVNAAQLIEFVSVPDSSVVYEEIFPQFNYFYRPNISADSLDMRIILRIDLKEKKVEFQTTGIFDPPTDVPCTTYHRTVYHFDLSMRLLWKDEYSANLSFFSKDQSEFKDSQTVYDYYENGMLKRELIFFGNHPDYYDQKGFFMEQTLYEITYRE